MFLFLTGQSHHIRVWKHGYGTITVFRNTEMFLFLRSSHTTSVCGNTDMVPYPCSEARRCPFFLHTSYTTPGGGTTDLVPYRFEQYTWFLHANFVKTRDPKHADAKKVVFFICTIYVVNTRKFCLDSWYLYIFCNFHWMKEEKNAIRTLVYGTSPTTFYFLKVQCHKIFECWFFQKRVRLYKTFLLIFTKYRYYLVIFKGIVSQDFWVLVFASNYFSSSHKLLWDIFNFCQIYVEILKKCLHSNVWYIVECRLRGVFYLAKWQFGGVTTGVAQYI
jgi:hypothetical protein